METRRHPAGLAGPAFGALAALVLAGAAGYLLSPDDPGTGADTVAGLIALAALARFAWKAWEWYADRLVVTDQRLFEVSGLLTRRVASMPLVKMTDMTYRRTVAGRLLGYGELVIESAGQKQALGSVRFVPRPDSFYRTITSLVTSPVRHETPVPVDDDDTGPLPRVRL